MTDSAEETVVVCDCCGKDLTDPKNAGDPDVEGQWVCRDDTCRAVHEVEMTVTLEDHQTSSYYDNTVTDCMECGVPLTRDQKVERSEGTYCESCAPPLVTDGGRETAVFHDFRKKHRDKGEALIASAVVGSVLATMMVSSGHTAEGLLLTGLMAVQMAVGWWL